MNGVLLALFLCVTVMNRHTLVSLFLVVVFLVLVSFPILTILKTCFDESSTATAKIIEFLESNPQFQVGKHSVALFVVVVSLIDRCG